MSTKLRGQFKHWCVAGLVGVSMLGACGAPEERTEAPAAAREAAEGDVSVSVSVGKSALRASDDVLVTVTLTNVSKSPVSLLKWHTPEDGIKDALFSVTRDGAPVAYIGRHYKRGAPQVTDYVTLAAGESLTRTVNLAHAYDLSQTGSYSLRYELDADHGGGFGVSALRSSDLTVWVEGRQSGAPELLAQAGTVSAQALSYAGACTSAEQSAIASAFSSAKTYSTNSLSYLTNTTPGNTSRYKTWFGSYTSTNWSTVKTHFSKIKTAFDTASVVVDCSCNDSAYAYVYPSSPYRIYVCNAFWSAPTTGTDSKAGTLVHEMSHFTVVAGTDDWAYGQTAAKNLAISNPTRAVDNADSHEYFAENTPALP